MEFGIKKFRLEPGLAYTAWAVVFNNPDACSELGCGEDDVFIDGDPSEGPNVDQISAAEIAVIWAGTGDIPDDEARGEFEGRIQEGDPPGQVLIDPALFTDRGKAAGLTDVAGAEIHFVVRDHGQAYEDEEELEEQLTTFQADCAICVDVQFSVHPPPTDLRSGRHQVNRSRECEPGLLSSLRSLTRRLHPGCLESSVSTYGSHRGPVACRSAASSRAALCDPYLDQTQGKGLRETFSGMHEAGLIRVRLVISRSLVTRPTSRR